MALENENRIHAAMGLSFAPQRMIVRVCRGVLLHTIEQMAPGIIECELVDGLGVGEVVAGTSIAPPADPPFTVAIVTRSRLTDRRWRFGLLRTVPGGDFGPCEFDVVWFHVATADGPARIS